jgi:hypothetical protein
MKRSLLILLLILGCASSRQIGYDRVLMRDGVVFASDTDTAIGRVVGVDYAEYGGRIMTSYRVEIVSDEWRAYEGQIVALILRTQAGATEVHITYR